MYHAAECRGRPLPDGRGSVCYASAMITPSPTAKIDPALARGTLIDSVPATATKPAYVKFGVPNTSYELHLIPTSPVEGATGKRLIGVVRAKARRMDVVHTGGRYVEPVMGHPRRVQGTVLKVEGDAVVVDAGVPIHVTPTDARQNASQFQPGDFVSFDVLGGATITVK